MDAARFLMMAVRNVRDVQDAVIIQTLPEYTEVTFTCDRMLYTGLCDRLAEATVVNYIYQKGWMHRVKNKLSPMMLTAAVRTALQRHIEKAFNCPDTRITVIRFERDGDLKITYEDPGVRYFK